MTSRERLSLAVAAALGMSLASAASSSTARAADLTWDGNGATAPNPADGSGNWEDADRWLDVGGGVHTPWNSATPDNAIFGAGSGPGTATATLTAGQTAGSITFAANSPTYTLTGGTLALNGAGGVGITANNSATINTPTTIAAAQTWLVDPGHTVTFGDGTTGGLTLNAGFTKNGAGSVVLNSPASGSNAQLHVNGGTLRLNHNLALGVNPHVNVNDGGTVHFHNFNTTGNSTAIGVWLNDGGTWKISGNVNYSKSGSPGINNGTAEAPVHAYINVENAADKISFASQIRNQVIHSVDTPSYATLHFNGAGTAQINTGGTGADPILYSGAIEVSNGKLLFGPRTAGSAAAETLNAAGFAADQGSARNANTITITGGVVGGMNNNPKLPSDGATQPPAPGATPRHYRANIVLAGGALATAGTSEGAGGTFTETGGIAGSRWGGHFTVAAGTPSRVLVHDPIQTIFPENPTGNHIALVGGAQGPMTSTAGVPVYNQGDTTWDGTLIVDPGGTTGGSFQITRDGGTIAVTPGAQIQVLSGAGLRLNGTADATSDGVDHVNVQNNSTIVGLEVSNGTKNVGNVSGSGSTTVLAAAGTAAAGNLIANHIRQSSATINGTAQIRRDGPGGATANVSSIGSLTIAADAKLDMTNNSMVTKTSAGNFNGTSYTGVQGDIARAYNFGSWDQPGLTTSEERAGQNAGPLSGTTTLGVSNAAAVLFMENPTDTGVWGGQSVTGTDTIVMYTYAGDMNFDGLVDGADYGIIDNSVQFPGTDGYMNGDLNYDGVIDGADYGIIDNTIQLQGDPIPVNGGIAGASLSGVTAVPEPASLSIIGLAAAALLGRRRRAQ